MHRRVAFLLFAAGWGTNHFATLLVVYRNELGLSSSELGILFGAYAVGLVPGLILAGRASDARGRRALVLPASILSIAASGVLAFGSHGFGLLLAGRLLFGLAMGCIMSPGSVWVQELSPPELGPRRATLALSAGFGIGPLASGVIAEYAPAPMVLPYVVHAVLMGIALYLARVVPETAKLRSTANTEIAEPADRASPLARASVQKGIGRRELLILAALLPIAPWSFGLASITGATLPGLMRPYVAHPVLYSGLVIMTTLVSGVLVQPLTTRIGRKADVVGLSIGIVGILVASYAIARHTPSIAFASAVLVGTGYGLVMTTGLRDVSMRVTGRDRGTVVGSYYVLTYIGFAGPFLHGSMAKTMGDPRTFLAFAGVASVCLLARTAIEMRPGASEI